MQTHRAWPQDTVDSPLTPDLDARLRRLVDEVGIDATGRTLQIPSQTIRRALAGRALRRGTRLMLDVELSRIGL